MNKIPLTTKLKCLFNKNHQGFALRLTLQKKLPMSGLRYISQKAAANLPKAPFAIIALLLSGLLSMYGSHSYAQKGYSTPWVDAYPLSGIDSLGQCFLEADWTDDEQQRLTNTAWQVMIHVDSLGQARIKEVLGLDHPEMESKMRNKSCLGAFAPRTMDGTALPAFYFLYHVPGKDGLRQIKEGPEAFENFGIELLTEEASELNYGSMGIDFFGGLYVPVFTGSAGNYFSPGIGGSFGLGIRFLRHLTFGVSVAYANHYTTDALPDISELRKGRSVGHFGAAFMLTGDLKFFSLSITGGLTEMGINAELTELSPVPTESLSGITTGLRIDVPVWSLTDKIGFKNASAFRNSSGLGVMLGARYNHFEAANLRGWMLEAGINYRWQKKDIKSFRLSNRFYDR